MEEFSDIFKGVSDPRRRNATRHDLHEMLVIALLSVLCGGEGCHDMALFGRSKERFLRRFMVLAHGIPSHDAFSDLLNALDPGEFQRVLLRLLGDFARNLAGVVAIDGKALSSTLCIMRRSITPLPCARCGRAGFFGVSGLAASVGKCLRPREQDGRRRSRRRRLGWSCDTRLRRMGCWMSSADRRPTAR